MLPSGLCPAMGYEAGDRLDPPARGSFRATVPVLVLLAAGVALVGSLLVFRMADGSCGSAGPACHLTLDPAQAGFVATILAVAGIGALLAFVAWAGTALRSGPIEPARSRSPPAPHAPAWGNEEEEEWTGPLP